MQGPISHGPFHGGELAAQAQAGVRLAGAPIRTFMSEQHRQFFPLLPFLPFAVADADGWPNATILTGTPGFAWSPDPRLLRIDALPQAGDPVGLLLVEDASVALLGIDLGTRRRNRLNGRVAQVDADGFSIGVVQSFGNCPRYIQARLATAMPQVAGEVEALSGLDPAAIRQIGAADTFFVASTAGGSASGLDMSHRGGRPGFIRIEGDTLVIPDFHGNRYFNTLGNFMLDPRAALLFVDFETGDLLHLSGVAEVDWQPEAAAGLIGAERVWRLRVVRGWRRAGAVPLRWIFQGYAPTTERTGTWAGPVA